MASRLAKRRALQETLDSEFPNFDNRPRKGNFVLKTTAPQTHPELKVGDSFRLRKLRNALARLREMQKLERLGKQLTGEYLNLQAKIRQSPLVLNGDVAQQAEQVEAAVQAERNSARKCRIDAWKESLRSSQGRRFRWLKTAAPQPSRGLHETTHGRPTRSTPESLALIKNFWSKVWVRPSVDLNALAEKVDQACDAVGFRAAQATASWAPRSANVFAAQVLKFKDKAAGPDGWLGNELVDWPIEFFEVFASFCATCENSSPLPAAWRVSKQVHLNKAG